jgi:hypothetical protein
MRCKKREMSLDEGRRARSGGVVGEEIYESGGMEEERSGKQDGDG